MVIFASDFMQSLYLKEASVPALLPLVGSVAEMFNAAALKPYNFIHRLAVKLESRILCTFIIHS